MNVDDEYAELRRDLYVGAPTAHQAPPPRRRLPTIKAWWVLLAGFLLSSVTTWMWLTVIGRFILRGGRSCTPDPFDYGTPPKYGCDVRVPPYWVVVVMTVASFAWLLWVSWKFMKGGPSGGGFFAIRALQERGEILYYAIVGGSLAGLLLLYGWAICWGPGGLVGQALIGLPMYLVGGGPRLPALILAAKAVIVFIGSIKIVGSISITTQGS